VELRRHDQEPPVPFIWSGIKKNSFDFVFGPSKSGKTTFCENLAMCLAAQLQKFFNQPISPDDYKVLFISLEEYWQNRTERNKKQVIPLNENLGTSSWLKNYKVINENVPRQIATDADWLEIERMIVNSKANVVFIDSLSRLYEGGIEDSGLAKKVSLQLRELTYKLKITLVVIQHTPKQTGKPIIQDSLAGSRMLSQEADFMIGIGKNIEGKRYFKEVSFRYCQEQNENVTVFDIDSYQWLIPGAEMPETALLKEPDGRKDDTNPDQFLILSVI
jgi:RecA-family ATPase